jgi:hypothetical protein
MEAARWLIVFVAFVTAIGGLLVDYFIPASGRQHIKNPKWPPPREISQRPDHPYGVLSGRAGNRDSFNGMF